jgi:hypothetical protein
MRVTGVVVLIGIVIAIDAVAVEHIVLVIRPWTRHDDALWRYHHPVAVLPLDLFDWTESGQRCARHYPIGFAVTLHSDVAVAGVSD